MNFSMKFVLAVSLLSGAAVLNFEQPSSAQSHVRVVQPSGVPELSQIDQLPIILAESVYRKKNVLVFTVKCIKPDDKDGEDELYFELRDGNGQSIFRTLRKKMEVDDTWTIEIKDSTFNGGTFVLLEHDLTPFGDDLVGSYKHSYATSSANYTKRMDGGRSLYEVSIEVRP